MKPRTTATATRPPAKPKSTAFDALARTLAAGDKVSASLATAIVREAGKSMDDLSEAVIAAAEQLIQT